jgi:hypothetical protein
MNTRYSTLAVVLFASFTEVPFEARAQQPGASEEPAFEEIVVTARKREERVRMCRSPSR